MPGAHKRPRRRRSPTPTRRTTFAGRSTRSSIPCIPIAGRSRRAAVLGRLRR